MGKKLQGEGRDSWTGILLTYSTLIPHYPGITVLKPASLPAPPHLTGDEEPDMLACWGAYLATARHFYPEIRRARARPPTPAELYALPRTQLRLLVHASRVLLELNTQPMVWCAWSIRSWSRYGPMRFRHNPPPLNHVYMKKRLEDPNSPILWSGEEREKGSHLVFARAHKQLITKWEKMRALLMQEHLKSGLTESKVRRIVRASLSSREFAVLAHKAQRETAEKQAEIDHALESGEYLWG